MKFKYDLHTHTKEGSCCSKVSAKEMSRYYKNLGYDGIFITDHLDISSTLPLDMPWAERMEMYYANGYLTAKTEGDKIGLKVFFAVEHSDFGNDFLLYNLTLEWWKKQADFLSIGINERLDRVREAGGFIIQAHPFNEAEWIDCIKLLPRKVDGVEIYNGKQASHFADGLANDYAEAYGLLKTGASDTHKLNWNMCGVETYKECLTAEDIIMAIKSGKATPFCSQKVYKRTGKEWLKI